MLCAVDCSVSHEIIMMILARSDKRHLGSQGTETRMAEVADPNAHRDGINVHREGMIMIKHNHHHG